MDNLRFKIRFHNFSCVSKSLLVKEERGEIEEVMAFLQYFVHKGKERKLMKLYSLFMYASFFFVIVLFCLQNKMLFCFSEFAHPVA